MGFGARSPQMTTITWGYAMDSNFYTKTVTGEWFRIYGEETLEIADFERNFLATGPDDATAFVGGLFRKLVNGAIKEWVAGCWMPYANRRSQQFDMVNHPPHYKSDKGIECIDAMRAALGSDGFTAFAIGNVIKYLWRDKTDKLEDLRKAAWYLDRAIKELENKQ